MFGSPEEKIFLLEPSQSEFNTKLKCDRKVSFGLIKVEVVDPQTYQHEINFIESPKHNQQLDLLIEPFDENKVRVFLYIYKEAQNKLLKGN